MGGRNGEGYGNIFSASSRKNGHAPNPSGPLRRYWIFLENSDKFTLLYDDSGGSFFIPPPVPQPVREGGRMYTGCCCCCCCVAAWFTSLPTRRHFNAVQSPFNKPINELLSWHARWRDQWNTWKCYRRKYLRTSRRRRNASGRPDAPLTRTMGELMRNLCFRNSVRRLWFGTPRCR